MASNTGSNRCRVTQNAECQQDEMPSDSNAFRWKNREVWADKFVTLGYGNKEEDKNGLTVVHNSM